MTGGFAVAVNAICFVPDVSAAIFSDPTHPVVEPARPTAAATPVLLLRKDLRDCFRTESDGSSFDEGDTSDLFFMLRSFRDSLIILAPYDMQDGTRRTANPMP